MQIDDDPIVFDDPETVYADWESARRLLPVLLVVLLLAISAFAAFRLLGRSSSDPADSVAQASPEPDDPQPVADVDEDPLRSAKDMADSFVQALGSGSLATQPFAFEQPAEVQAEINVITAQLGAFTLAATAGTISGEDDHRSFSPTRLEWTLDDGTVFSTEGELRMVLVGQQWQIDWDPGVINAGLTPGDVLVRERVTAPRAPILGRDGFQLVGPRPTLQIGVVPRDVSDAEQTADRLSELLDVDAVDLADLIRRSPSDDVLVLAERRLDVVEPIRGQLAALGGIHLSESEAPLTPYDGYGRALLGWAGEATAEILQRSPGYFEVGDVVGRSGLQATYNEQLAGSPGFRVRIDRRFSLRDDAGQEIPPDADVNVIYLSAPQPAEALQTTIDNRAQNAAERALTASELPSALVAVQASTGEVLAVANGPGPSVQNNAMTGQYPPGSIFKIVTAYAALAQGATPGQQFACPLSVVVDGKEFRNSEGHNLGTVALRQAFAQSCNTTFVELGLSLDRSTLPSIARQLGIGADYRLGTAAFAGSVPQPGSQVDQAASAFGQGQVLVSPLSMAVMAASVASGRYHPPVLVRSGQDPVAAETLAPGVVGDLRQMMADVVNSGTGRAASQAAGGQIFGKTGSAEFGNDDPPRTHAWFVGYQGDVAFAVLVEGGGFGGSVAAPIAARFLTALAEQG